MKKPEAGVLIRASVRDRLLTIALSYEGKRKVITTSALQSIAQHLDDATSRREILCVVITGATDTFAMGANLNELRSYDATSILGDPRLKAWKRIWAFPKPLIAAVEGYCLGAGSELVLACDIVIAGQSAQFAQPEINLGIMPGAGGTQILPRKVGMSLSAYMVLTGKFITADRAQQAGWVLDVVADGTALTRAIEIATTISEKAPLAVQGAIGALRHSYETASRAGLEYERRIFESLFSTQDREEGMSAFFEKRKPTYTGR